MGNIYENYDPQLEELIAKGGTFDLTGTDPKINGQFFGFHAGDTTVIASIKGVALGTDITTLAKIRAAEIDVSALLVTSLTPALFTGVLYRVDGYVITSITLTSGSLHLYKTKEQVTA